MEINANWHKDHPMPHHPSKEQRIRWHTEHVRWCGCQPMPKGIEEELQRRMVRAAAARRPQ
jgi:hypothetical protein